MYRQCTTEKTIYQQHCLEACMLQMMERKSFSDISVTELCQQTGITRRIFYRLYEAKEDVLSALIDHTLLQYAEYELPASFHVPKDKAPFYRFFSFWLEQRKLLDALAKNSFSTLLMQRVMMFVVREETHIFSAFGVQDLAVDMDVLIYHFTGMIALVARWQDTGYQKTVDEMAQQLENLTRSLPVAN